MRGKYGTGGLYESQLKVDQRNESMDEPKQLIFATFAEDEHQLLNARVLAESIREFGGRFRHSIIWIYVPYEMMISNHELLDNLTSIEAEIKTCRAPEAALKFPYGRKVFAAASAEEDAAKLKTTLVWLDDDTVFLQEPAEFVLPDSIQYGFRPVMHKNIGSLYSEPPDSFWGRAYELLNITDEMLFPMETHTDHLILRPYINAGVQVVRPEQGIMRTWAESFPVLYGDPDIVRQCSEDRLKAIFLHQVALSCAVLKAVDQGGMCRLSDRINYPIFFKEMFGAADEYDDLGGVVSLRYDYYFRDPAPDWRTKLKGPKKVINWLAAHLDTKTK